MNQKKATSKSKLRNPTVISNRVGSSISSTNGGSNSNTDILMDEPDDYRTITVTIESYQNIVPVYITADISTQCTYSGKNMLQTGKTLITDDATISVEESFTLTMNINDFSQLDRFVTIPLIFTVTQIENLSQSIEILAPEQPPQASRYEIMDIENTISMYEAFTGAKFDRDDNATSSTGLKVKKGKNNKVKIGAKNKTKDKIAKDKKRSKSLVIKPKTPNTSNIDANVTPKDPRSSVYGICCLDMICLLKGTKSFTETLLINPLEKFMDERMVPCKLQPKIVITVSVDEILSFSSQPEIINLTVESIYNIPSMMKQENEYTICCKLPNVNLPKEPVVFTNPKYTSAIQDIEKKCWPGLPRVGADANTTIYKINQNPLCLKNTVGYDIRQIFTEEKPRLVFITLKRNVLFIDGKLTLMSMITKYRKIVFEIFMTTKQKNRPSASSPTSGDDIETPSASDRKGITLSDPFGSKQYLHLMAIVDVSTLLYAGVTRTRVATQLTTYHELEANNAGLTESYFFPKVQTVDEKPLKNKKEQKGKDKKSKESKSNKSSLKSKPDSAKKKVKNMEDLLPGEPEQIPPMEPSKKVYCEDGSPCFIVIEIELTDPLNKTRPIDDLHNSLSELLQKKPHLPKLIMPSQLINNFYQETLNELIVNVNEMYHKYLEEKAVCSCLNQADFLTYLKRTGVYQSYLGSIIKAVSCVIINKFNVEDLNKYSMDTYVSEIFVYLVSEMNSNLNKMLCTGFHPACKGPQSSLNTILFYAKEAAIIGNHKLADRYFLERLCLDNKNPDYWFDYAVYKLQCDETARATQCVRQALDINMTHRNSLLLFGMLLADNDQKNEAETCFMTLMVHYSFWTEGWGILYLFYERLENFEGMEMALSMSQKNLSHSHCKDYYSTNDDLVFTEAILPVSVFIKTATLALKMRMYQWAEEALAHEMSKHYGEVQYLLAAIYYYKGLYLHALEHMVEAELHHGPDYGTLSLVGHCLLAIGKYDLAYEKYSHILESFNRPDDMYMVYVNCSICLEAMQKTQEARKMILLACKYHSTPYSWLKAGIFYLKQNDFLSAEECLSEANLRDNRCPNIWGYLTLVNLKLYRTCEAELCYRQAIKNELNDDHLLTDIKKEAKKIMQMYGISFPI